jgi:hypothetical protein
LASVPESSGRRKRPSQSDPAFRVRMRRKSGLSALKTIAMTIVKAQGGA